MTIIGLFITSSQCFMFAGLKPRYELHHGVRISDRAVVPLFARRLISSRAVEESNSRDFKIFQVEISQFPTTSKSIQVNPSHDDLFGNNQTSHRWLQLCSVTVTFQTVSFQTKLSTSWMKLLRRLGWPYGRCRRLLDSCMLLSSANITRWRWKSPQNLQNWNAWIGRFCSISTAILALSHWSFFSFFYLWWNAIEIGTCEVGNGAPECGWRQGGVSEIRWKHSENTTAIR